MKERFELASDNTAGICPEAWEKLREANAGECSSYGEDRWTTELCRLVREIFERDCEVFLVFNGTAANSLALAQLARPFHSILCHEFAHIECDECGAPEFFSGGSKVIPVPGALGKLDLGRLEEARKRQRELHSPRPGVLSITQSTELGTVYTEEELGALADYARQKNLRVQMDGARFANACAALGCAPGRLVAGVDVLCFGGTKNGTAAGDLVVFFERALAEEFDYRAKQAGQLASKMRFMAAPWVGLLENNVWLKNAAHANAMARRLAEGVRGLSHAPIVFPVEASALFLRLEERVAEALRARGWHFYKFIEPDVYRVMCSWAVTAEVVDQFVADLKAVE